MSLKSGTTSKSQNVFSSASSYAHLGIYSSIFCDTAKEVCSDGSVASTIRCFRRAKVRILSACRFTIAFKCPQRKKSSGVKSELFRDHFTSLRRPPDCNVLEHRPVENTQPSRFSMARKPSSLSSFRQVSRFRVVKEEWTDDSIIPYATPDHKTIGPFSFHASVHLVFSDNQYSVFCLLIFPFT